MQDDRIAQIAPGITEPADQVIDATGKAVTPGFVNIHRHHDAKPLNDPHFGEVELAQGITTHIRGEGDCMVQSVREVIEIARRVGCALEISHFKSCGMKNWGKDIHTAIADIEAARAEDMDVTVDFYPYEGGSTALTTMLPPVFVAGNMTRAVDV